VQPRKVHALDARLRCHSHTQGIQPIESAVLRELQHVLVDDRDVGDDLSAQARGNGIHILPLVIADAVTTSRVASSSPPVVGSRRTAAGSTRKHEGLRA
jgi:hypothetical protein